MAFGLQVEAVEQVVGEFSVTRKKPPKRAWEVLDYFFRNPQAADTLEGVARWRLLQETVHRGVEETTEALEWLVSQGLLKETPKTYSRPIYSLNSEAMAEAERFLTGKKPGEHDEEARSDTEGA
jgi:hypothetical protein